MMEFNRARLKRDVKLSMKRTSPNPILVALLLSVVVSAGTWLINTVLGGLLTRGSLGSFPELYLYFLRRGMEAEEAMKQAVLALLSQGPGNIFAAVVGGAVLSVIASLWQSTMNVGYEGWCLSMVRNENPPVGKVFGALPIFVPVLITRFLTGLFLFLWGLLVAAGYGIMIFAAVMVMALTESVLIGLPLLLAAVVFFALGTIWVSVRYALVDFVLLDKGLYGLEAIRENKRLMKGNAARMFMLRLSFIGWYLLIFGIVFSGLMAALVAMASQISGASTGGLLIASGFALMVIAAAGIGSSVLMLWLKPYVTGSVARFYDWAGGAADSFGGGPGFGGGWGGPADYTWSSGTGARGTGMGPGNGPSNSDPPKPKDDPWN